jgi:flagellar assembly protein FliH
VSETAIIPRAALAGGTRVLEPRRAVREPDTPAIPEQCAAAAIDAAAAAAGREQEIAEAVAAARAELEAEHLQCLEEELARARDSGRAEGALEGREAALQEARAERREASDRLNAVLAAVEEARIGLVDRAEETAVAIGFATACRILGESLLTREGVRAAVRAVLAQARSAEHAVIRMHPADAARLDELQDSLAPSTDVRIVADAAIEAGGCRIETSAGTLESRLVARLAEMRDALLAAHRAPAEQEG